MISEIESETIGQATRYSPDVAYEYQVGGVNYFSNAVSAETVSFADQKSAKELADRYPLESKVTVYYDPNGPKRSVLEPGSGAGNPILMGVSVVLVVFGLSGIVISLTSKKQV